MFLTDTSALKKANEIIVSAGKKAVITRYFWVKAEDEKDDIFCYFVKQEGSKMEYFPGIKYPLFKRNGEMTDFCIPIPA